MKLWSKLPRLYPESLDLLHLDVLRIVSACGIVGVHLQLYALHVGPGFKFRFGGLSLLVDVFFAISGIVISYVYADRMQSGSDYWDFMRRRFSRLVPLHLVTAIASVPLVFIATNYVQHLTMPPDAPAICHAATYAMLQAWGACPRLVLNGPSWSISAEIGMYALFPLFLVLARHGWLVTLGLAGTLIIVLTWFGSAFGLRPWYSWTYDFGVARAAPSFLVGMGLYQARHLLQRIPFPGVGLGGASALFGLGCVFELPKLPLLIAAYAIVLFAFAADTQKRASPLVRQLAPLGQLTYAVYMIHAPLLLFVASIIGRGLLGLDGAMAWTLTVFTAVILLPALSFMAFWGLERPAKHYLLALSHGSNKPTAEKPAASPDTL